MAKVFLKKLCLDTLRLLLLAPLLLMGSMVFGANGDVVRIRSDSPLQYEVVKGDTLWDISGRFLEEPWLWPEVWQDNPQIVNPHLIYPGDIVVLVYVDGEPRLTLQREGGLPVVKLSPEVRREVLLTPIPAIPLEDIEAFLSKNRVAEVDEMENAPSLLGSQGGEVYSAEDDIVYAFGNWGLQDKYYDIIRPEREVRDRISGEVIGVEAIIIGYATRIHQEGQKGTLRITKSFEEISLGDRFLPKMPVTFEPTFFPAPPPFEVDSEIVDIEFGETYGGAGDTTILNVGKRDGVEPGHLLALQKADHIIDHEGEQLHFSGEYFGDVLIYQVFKDFSLGLILNSKLAVKLQDKAASP